MSSLKSQLPTPPSGQSFSLELLVLFSSTPTCDVLLWNSYQLFHKIHSLGIRHFLEHNVCSWSHLILSIALGDRHLYHHILQIRKWRLREVDKLSVVLQSLSDGPDIWIYVFFFFNIRVNIISLFFFFKYLFIYFWLCWVFVSVRGLSLVAASGDHSSLQCAGLSVSRPLLLRSTGSRRAGSVVVAHGPSRSAACGIFPDQGSNPCPLHWQADSQPLRHQGSPEYMSFNSKVYASTVTQCRLPFKRPHRH